MGLQYENDRDNKVDGINMIKSIKDLDIKGKRVLIRVDFNVPIDSKGKITDDFRIKSAIPTIEYLLNNGAKQVVLMSHLGRPQKELKDGMPEKEVREKFTLKPVAERLGKFMKTDVAMLDDCIGVKLPHKRLCLLENLRFYKEETKNDSGFAKKLAENGDVYVNDAFGTCHRAHASVEGIVKYFKDYAAGLLLQKEIEMLTPIVKNPEKPFYLILGGAKVKDKIGVIENLQDKTNKILIGGKMALAFADMNYIDKEDKVKAGELLKKYANKIILPVDYVLENVKDVTADSLPDDIRAYDVGHDTISDWKRVLEDAKTIVWNGPLGYFEKKPFDKATNELARYLACSKATTIIGGGDSSSAVRKLDLQDKMNHVSTGGGASLEFLEGKELPGIKALES